MKLLLAILFSLNIFAADLESCSPSFAKLGDGSGNDQISNECKQLIMNNDDTKIKVVHKDALNDLEYNALGSALVSIDRVKGFQAITSGNMTKLQDVKAMEYVHEYKELYVLDGKTHKVYVFLSELPGNVAPTRIIEKDELIGASDIAILADSIYILNGQTNKVIVMNRQASSKAPESRQFLNIIQVVDVAPGCDRLELKDTSLEVYKADEKIMTLELE